MMHRTAQFSPCGLYRFRLGREWDDSRPPVAFVMLNPSTADAEKDDPTVYRCIDFARRWGHGSLVVLNIFALKSTDPRKIAAHYLGPVDNRQHNPGQDRVEAGKLREYSEGLRIVAAWGHHADLWAKWGGGAGIGEHRSRQTWAKEVLAGRQLEALAVTELGHPRHPLYTRKDTSPIIFRDGTGPVPPEPLPIMQTQPLFPA